MRKLSATAIFFLLLFGICVFCTQSSAAEQPDLEQYGLSSTSSYEALKDIMYNCFYDYPYQYVLHMGMSYSSLYTKDYVDSNKTLHTQPKYLVMTDMAATLETTMTLSGGNVTNRVFFKFPEGVKFKVYKWTTDFSERTSVSSLSLSNVNQCASSDGWILDATNWICFTNEPLVDSAGIVPTLKIYEPKDLDDGKTYNQEDESSDPEEKPTTEDNILTVLKSIPDKLNALIASCDEFFTHWETKLVDCVLYTFVPTYVDEKAIDTIYDDFNDMVDEKYPVIGQIRTACKKLIDMDNYDPFEKYVCSNGVYDDGGMRGSWTEKPNYFKFKMPESWSGNSKKEFNLLNWGGNDYSVNLDSALLLANTIITAMLWGSFLMKMYKRIPTMLDVFKV